MQALLAIYSNGYSDGQTKTFICGNDESVVWVNESGCACMLLKNVPNAQTDKRSVEPFEFGHHLA